MEPNPSLPVQSGDDLYAAILGIGLPAAWVQKVGLEKYATSDKMAMITQIIETGSSVWPFEVPLHDLQAVAPGDSLRQVTMGQYWLWFALEFGDDYLGGQFEARLPAFDSTLEAEARQRQALLMLKSIVDEQTQQRSRMLQACLAWMNLILQPQT